MTGSCWESHNQLTMHAEMFTCDKCMLPVCTSLSTHSFGAEQLTTLIKISFSILNKEYDTFHLDFQCLAYQITYHTDLSLLPQCSALAN